MSVEGTQKPRAVYFLTIDKCKFRKPVMPGDTIEYHTRSIGGRKTMSLNVKRTVEQGHIRQNFSHGRSKSVLVETKRKRAIPGGGFAEEQQPKSEPVVQKPEHRAFQKPDQQADKRPQKVLRQLSAGEVLLVAKILIGCNQKIKRVFCGGK